MRPLERPHLDHSRRIPFHSKIGPNREHTVVLVVVSIFLPSLC